jgi:hypothetical protein
MRIASFLSMEERPKGYACINGDRRRHTNRETPTTASDFEPIGFRFSGFPHESEYPVSK